MSLAEAQGSVVDRFNSRSCYPVVDVVDVEPQEVAPFHVGDASFEHEPADVTDRDAQVLGDLLDRNESGSSWRACAGRRAASDVGGGFMERTLNL